jgi:hypothetical protein
VAGCPLPSRAIAAAASAVLPWRVRTSSCSNTWVSTFCAQRLSGLVWRRRGEVWGMEHMVG